MLLRSGVAVAVVLGMVAALGAADAHAQEHDASKDFDLLAASSSPAGIWSDGTTMWVAARVDGIFHDGMIYAYNMATKERDSAKDLDTPYARPTGIWSDGTTIWVTEYDERIYAYNMATKERDGAKDFGTLSAAGNRAPSGIWSDGTTIWVADYHDGKIYAYAAIPGTGSGLGGGLHC